jgi:hypothetical protein
MRDRRRTYIGIAVIALLALAVVALPNGDAGASMVQNLIQSAFLAILAIAAVRLYRSQSEWFSGLPDRDRGILYGSIAIAILVIVATARFGDLGVGGIILEILILGACGGAAFWVWRESRRWVI